MKNHLNTLRSVDWLSLLGAYYPLVIRMAGAGLQLLNNILITRELKDTGSEKFLFWSMIIMTSTGMASYGLEQLSLRDVPRLQLKGVDAVRGYLNGVFSISISLALLIGMGLLVYAQFIEGWASWQLLIPIGLVSMTVILIFGEVLKGLSHPVLGMLFGHFLPVSLFTVMILLFGSNLTPVNVIVFWIVGFLIALFVLRFSGQAELKLNLLKKPDTALLKKLLKESSSVFVGGVFGALSFMLPVAILKAYSPGPEVSYVATAFKISILTMILSAAIHSVFAPKISRAAENFDRARLLKSYGKAVLFSLAALGPPIIVGIIFPEFVMQIFGDSFKSGANTLRLLLLTNLISLVMGPVLQLLIMIGYNRLLPRFGFFKLLIAVVASLLLVPKFGSVGMVLAMGGAFLIEELVILGFIVMKLTKTPTS